MGPLLALLAVALVLDEIASTAAGVTAKAQRSS